jgi:hypothetical protein
METIDTSSKKLNGKDKYGYTLKRCSICGNYYGKYWLGHFKHNMQIENQTKLFQMMSLKNQTSFSKVASYTKAINLQILQ